MSNILKLASSNWVIIILLIILIWRILKQNWILFLILGFLVWKNKYDKKHYKQENGEEFDADMREFVPLGQRRYDLRGAPMDIHPHPDCKYTNYGDCYNSNL